jgi:hypothetical protein
MVICAVPPAPMVLFVNCALIPVPVELTASVPGVLLEIVTAACACAVWPTDAVRFTGLGEMLNPFDCPLIVRLTVSVPELPFESVTTIVPVAFAEGILLRIVEMKSPLPVDAPCSWDWLFTSSHEPPLVTVASYVGAELAIDTCWNGAELLPVT